MDESHRTVALAGIEKGICPSLFATPTNFALHFPIGAINYTAVDFYVFLRIELVLTLLAIIIKIGLAVLIFVGRGTVSLLHGRGASVDHPSSF